MEIGPLKLVLPLRLPTHWKIHMAVYVVFLRILSRVVLPSLTETCKEAPPEVVSRNCTVSLLRPNKNVVKAFWPIFHPFCSYTHMVSQELCPRHLKPKPAAASSLSPFRRRCALSVPGAIRRARSTLAH